MPPGNARFQANVLMLFRPKFCKPASGWEKGIVEKNVQDRRNQVWREDGEQVARPRQLERVAS